jgi:DNA-binding SARP family transcriptional activator
VQFGILGPLTIERDGEALTVRAPKQRALLTHLLVRVWHTVPTDLLIESLWGDHPPQQARVTLRSYLSNLRRVLGDDAEWIVSRSNGYALQVEPAAVDAHRFERLVASARSSLAGGDPAGALGTLEEALASWRGEALADAADSSVLRGDVVRLEELRRAAYEDRHDALLALQRPGEVVAAAEWFLTQEPLRERARAQLMLALHRVGRGPDALRAFREFRDHLVEELGLDPSPKLQHLADRILAQAPELDDPIPSPSGGTGPPVAAVPPPAAAATPRASAGLVGRDHERGELRAAVGRLGARQGGLVLVSGEPGIGKTALLESLRRGAAAAGVPAYVGRCPETEGAPAFWPWVQVLGAVAEHASDDELTLLVAGDAGPVTQLVPSIADRVGERRTVAGADAEARFGLYEAVSVLFRRAAATRPRLVLLDDLHWADTPSLQLLAYLAPQLADSGVLVAGSYRSVPADWSPELATTLGSLARVPVLQQIGLAGLLPDEVAELVTVQLGESPSPRQRDLLCERTGGNPFFVRQLAQLLAERPSAIEDGVPSGVGHVLSRRLAVLPVASRELLEAAAVMGRCFDLRPLAQAVGVELDAAIDVVAPALEHRLVEPDGRPVTGHRFVHALVRETIIDGLSAARGARLHRDVGIALAATPDPPVEQVAEHLWLAADLLHDDRPVSYLLLAADQARAVLAHEQAETYLRRALELSHGDVAAELPVLLRLLNLLMTVHGWAVPDVRDLTARALELTRRVPVEHTTAAEGRTWPPSRIGLWWTLWTCHVNRSELRSALDLAGDLLAEAAPDDRLARGAGEVMRAHTLLALGVDPGTVLDELGRPFAVAVADLRAYGRSGTAVRDWDRFEGSLTVVMHGVRGLGEAYRGRSGAALEEAGRAVEVAAATGDVFARAWGAMMAAWIGVTVADPAFVDRVAAPGLGLSAEHGFRLLTQLLSVSSAWARARLGGDPATAAEEMRRGVERVRSMGVEHAQAQYLLLTAETFLAADDRARAAACLEEARELSARTGDLLPPRQLARVVRALDRAGVADTTAVR